MSKKGDDNMNYRLIVTMPYLYKRYLEEMTEISGESMAGLINRLIIAEYARFEDRKNCGKKTEDQ
jgi:hypothetical protein